MEFVDPGRFYPTNRHAAAAFRAEAAHVAAPERGENHESRLRSACGHPDLARRTREAQRPHLLMAGAPCEHRLEESMRDWAALALVLWLAAVACAAADEPAQEFWPEIDVWWRLSPAWRVSLFVPISRNIETAYRDGNFIPQVDYAFGKTRPAGDALLDEAAPMTLKPVVRAVTSEARASTTRAGVHRADDLRRGAREDAAQGGRPRSHRLRSDFAGSGARTPTSRTAGATTMIEKELARGRRRSSRT